MFLLEVLEGKYTQIVTADRSILHSGSVPITDDKLSQISKSVEDAGVVLSAPGNGDSTEPGAGWDGGVVWLVPTDRPIPEWKVRRACGVICSDKGDSSQVYPNTSLFSWAEELTLRISHSPSPQGLYNCATHCRRFGRLFRCYS